MSHDLTRPCPDACGGTLKRDAPWDARWECDGCGRRFEFCDRCGSATPYSFYERSDHGIEDCIAALGKRLAALEAKP